VTVAVAVCSLTLRLPENGSLNAREVVEKAVEFIETLRLDVEIIEEEIELL
jgi:hypothetical protein